MHKKMTPFWLRFYVICFALICVITLVVSVTFGYVFFERNKQYLDESTNNIMSYADSTLYNYLSKFSKIVGSTNISELIYNAKYSDNSYAGNGKYRTEIVRLFDNIYSETRGIDAIFYMDKDGYYYNTGANMGGKSVCQSIYEQCKTRDTFIASKELWLYGKNVIDDKNLILCREIIYLDSSYAKHELGFVLIAVDSNAVYTECFSFFNSTNAGLIFADSEGIIALASNKSLTGQKYSDYTVGKNKFILSGVVKSTKNVESRISGWENISYTNVFVAFSQNKNSMVIILLFILTCLLVILLILKFCLRRMSRPISDLFNIVKTADNKGADKYPCANNEIAYIASAFNNMVDDLKTEVHNNYLSKIKLKEAAMEACERQMNPHFLYNTLQMIQMMSIVGDEKKIPTVTNCVGKMLRFNLNGESQVKLSEEIKNCEYYFTILKLRYGDMFNYRIIVPQDIQNLYSIKFLLQPFVENAVTHAFKGKKDPWEIVVMATVVWSDVIIIIKDNGSGITPEKLEEIKQRLARKDKIYDSGIGIKNVHDRLELFYGEEYGVDVFSTNRGTQIMIHMPIVEKSVKGELQDA